MSTVWPIPLDGFFDPLPVAQVRFDLADSRTFSVNGGGEVIAHQLGARLWTGSVSIGVTSLADAAAYEAKLALLQQAGGSFLIYDRRKAFPRLDPAGAQIAAWSPFISQLAANNRQLRIGGLPGGYQISDGDMIAFAYGANPTRRALHRVVTGGSAGSVSGVTGLIEVIPYIRPGASINAPVVLSKPVCKAVLTEASYGTGRSTISRGATFSWMQTLR